jgi:DNA-binding CsgD family transcriptional regulator
MAGAQIDRLTPTQKFCLRMVLLRHSSKDIARELDSSPHTIDNHIKAAVARLGAENRFEAARMLSEYEEPKERRSLASQTSALANTPETRFKSVSFEPFEQETEHDVAYSKMAERKGIFGPFHHLASTGFLPIPSYWGQRNHLSLSKRLGWIVALIALISLSIGAVTASLRSLQGLL